MDCLTLEQQSSNDFYHVEQLPALPEQIRSQPTSTASYLQEKLGLLMIIL